ncbi:MAG: hypothetical protein AAFX08_07450 [Pseudomonadota bacterium]
MSAKRRGGKSQDAGAGRARPVGGRGPEGPLPNAVRPDGPSPDDLAASTGGAAAGSRLGGVFVGGAPLLPDVGATGAPMTAVIAVMSALAALALAGFIAIAAAAERWTDDLEASMTVQVKGADKEEIDGRTLSALSVLEAADGVSGIQVRPPEEAAKLLTPWLGEGASAYLSVPALIDFKVDAAARADLGGLRARLVGASDGLILDDHGVWNDSLRTAARSGQALTFGIFVLVTAAACAIAAFAARAGLAANADVISLLHLVGATDAFIAGEVQKRFLFVSLRGSLIGLAAAAAAIAALTLIVGASGPPEFFLPSFATHPALLAPMLLVPAAISAATSVTARRTVLASLKQDL